MALGIVKAIMILFHTLVNISTVNSISTIAKFTLTEIRSDYVDTICIYRTRITKLTLIYILTYAFFFILSRTTVTLITAWSIMTYLRCVTGVSLLLTFIYIFTLLAISGITKFTLTTVRITSIHTI